VVGKEGGGEGGREREEGGRKRKGATLLAE